MPFDPNKLKEASKPTFDPSKIADSREVEMMPSYTAEGAATGYYEPVTATKADPVGIGTYTAIMEPIYGVGELIPGQIGERSAAAAKELERKYKESTKQYPYATRVGYGATTLAELLTPGTALKALGFVPKVAEATSALSKIAAGAKEGALTGGLYEFAQPTGKQKYGERLEVKGVRGTMGALSGGAFGAALPAAYEAYKAARALPDTYRAAKASGAISEAEAVRTETADLLENQIQAQRTAADQTQSRLTAIENAQAQLAQGEQTALQRAEAATTRPRYVGEEARARAQSPSEMALEAQRARVSSAEKRGVEAGLTKEEATNVALDLESKRFDAEQAVQALESSLSPGQSLSKQEFGSFLRRVADDFYEKYDAIREAGAGFSKALKSAGQGAIVPTDRIATRIANVTKKMRNPQTQAILNNIDSMIKTNFRGEPVNRLSMQSADSVRKYLNSVLAKRRIMIQNTEMAVDKEAAYHIREIKNMIERAAGNANPAYKEAIAKHAKLSEPLRIFEKEGALSKILDTDIYNQQYQLGEAAVVGRILQRANQGKDAFTKLIAENPELKNQARMYFYNELFGGGRKADISSLDRFLRANEPSLKQLGLYEEFSTLNGARKSAQKAVEEFRLGEKVAKEGVKQYGVIEKEAERGLSRERLKTEMQKRRVSEAIKADPTMQELIKSSQLRRGKAETQLTGKAGALRTEAEKTKSSIEKYSDLQKDLARAKPEEIGKETRKIVESLKKDQAITGDKRDELLRQIQMIEDRFGKTKEAQDLLKELTRKAIGFGVGGVAAGLGASFVGRELGGM